jgi:hypothetical protein
MKKINFTTAKSLLGIRNHIAYALTKREREMFFPKEKTAFSKEKRKSIALI